MFNRFALFTACALVFSTSAFAEETALAEDTEQAKINAVELQGRKKINDEINHQIYNSSTQDLNELVRNANALKRLDNPNYKDKVVDVQNKAELRAFIKDHIGLKENIRPESQLIKTPTKKQETPDERRLRARKALQM